MSFHPTFLLALLALLLFCSTSRATYQHTSSGRAKYCYSRDLVGFYPIDENDDDDKLHDRSGFGNAVDLEFRSSRGRCTGGAYQNRHRKGRAGSKSKAYKITSALRDSREFTVEAWISADHSSIGNKRPARIVSLSRGTRCPDETGFQIGQDQQGKIVCRTGVAKTGSKSKPSCGSVSLTSSRRLSNDKSEPTHIVLTVSKSGTATVYVDGEAAGSKELPGTISHWSDALTLNLGNEATENRNWDGKLHKVAIWKRVLSAREVLLLFNLGVDKNTASDDCNAPSDDPPTDDSDQPEDPDAPTEPYCYASQLVAFYPITPSDCASLRLRDHSHFGDALDLHGSSRSHFRCVSKNDRDADEDNEHDTGAVSLVHERALFKSATVATKVSSALRNSALATIEAWVSTSSSSCRSGSEGSIVTLSRQGSSCPFSSTFAVEQTSKRGVVSNAASSEYSCQTTATSSYVLPKRLSDGAAHVVVTIADGQHTVYVDGVKKRQSSASDLYVVDSDMYLTLGNVLGLQHGWNGILHKVAIWSHALSAEQVSALFDLGPSTNEASDACKALDDPQTEPPVHDDKPRDCTTDADYWEAFSKYGSKRGYDPVWAKAGEDTTFFKSHSSWYNCIRSNSDDNKSDYFALAREYCVSWLNRAAGANMDDETQPAFFQALSFFREYTPSQCYGNRAKVARYLKEKLRKFNRGERGPGRCEDSDPDDPPTDPPPTVSCTYTQGYWYTHSKYGPASRSNVWGLVGEDTRFYDSGTTYHAVMRVPVRGNAYYILARQFVAATLNKAQGADMPSNVRTAFNNAESFFSSHAPGYCNSNSCDSIKQIAELLDAYNNGRVGPGHCDDGHNDDNDEPEVPSPVEGYCEIHHLVAFYSMHEAYGTTVHDRAPRSRPAPLDLTLSDSGVEWDSAAGGLRFFGGGAASADDAAALLSEALQETGQFSVEAWISTSEEPILSGAPARIIALSDSATCPTGSNFVIGQDGSSSEQHVSVRLSTSQTTSCESATSTFTQTLETQVEIRHMVVTFDGLNVRLFMDSVLIKSVPAPGALAGAWTTSASLRLGSEQFGTHAWNGTIHKLAVWDAPLSEQTVRSLHDMGRDGMECEHSDEDHSCELDCDAATFEAANLPPSGVTYECGSLCEAIVQDWCPESMPSGYSTTDSSTASRAISDTCTKYPSSHAVWLPDWSSSGCFSGSSSGNTAEWIFEPEGSASFKLNRSAGTARLEGIIRQTRINPDGDYYRMHVELDLSSMSDGSTPSGVPNGSPKLEQKAWCSDHFPFDHWIYFSQSTGMFTGIGALEGAQMRFNRKGPAFQIGVGANGKNLAFGASGWFDWTRVSQVADDDASCHIASSTGHGDFNLDVKPECIVRAPTEPPVVDPDCSSLQCDSGEDCDALGALLRDEESTVLSCDEGFCVATVDDACDNVEAIEAHDELSGLSWSKLSAAADYAFYCEYCFYDCGYGPGKYWRFHPDNPGVLREYENGTALITGTLVNTYRSWYTMDISVHLSNRVDSIANPWVPSGTPSSVVDDWYFYKTAYARVSSGFGPLAGLNAFLSVKDHPLQIGHYANFKNSGFGAAIELKLTETSRQPTDGKCKIRSRRMKMKLNVQPKCQVRSECIPEEPPVEADVCEPCVGNAECVEAHKHTDGYESATCSSAGVCDLRLSGPCSQHVDTADGYRTLTVHHASSYASNGHAFWCRECFTCLSASAAKKWIFDAAGSGRLVENGDGTARLTGTLRNVHDSSYELEVDVWMTGLADADNAPDGSPKLPNSGSVNTDNWRYYSHHEGRLFGIRGPLRGFELQLVRDGPSFQIGVGANVKNDKFGGSGWNEHVGYTQPSNGQCVFTGRAKSDFNLNLGEMCELEPVCIDEPPIEPPDEEECLGQECRYAHECAEAFPEALREEGKLSCERDDDPDGDCKLTLGRSCPTDLSPLEYETSERDVIVTPCGHVLFCYKCFTCQGFALSPNWKMIASTSQVVAPSATVLELSGTLVNMALHHPFRLNMDVRLEGGTDTPPPNSPYWGLRDPGDNSGWKYYPIFSGTVWSDSGPLAGVNITFGRHGPAAQLGNGANTVNDNYGLGAWLDFSNGPYEDIPLCRFNPAAQGELTLDVKTLCEITPLCPEEPPVEPPSCPPGTYQYDTREELIQRAFSTPLIAQSRVGGRQADETELSFEDGQTGSTIVAAHLDYPTSGQQLRSFSLSYNPETQTTTFTETVLAKSSSQMVSSTIETTRLSSSSARFDTLTIKVNNDCKGDNVLRVHHMHLSVDGQNVPLPRLNRLFVGSGELDILELAFTGVNRDVAWQLTGRTTIFRSNYRLDDEVAPCSGDMMAWEVLLSERAIHDCPPDVECPHIVDFEELQAGDVLSDPNNNPYAGLGVRITTEFANDPDNSHPPMIFDSANPTGSDFDLGSPNTAFGGTGNGAGGGEGKPGENRNPLGNVLIISEDGDPSDPDDRARGGTIVFTFDSPVTFVSLSVLDVDEDGGTMKAKAADGTVLPLEDDRLYGFGDNSFHEYMIARTGVSRFELHFAGSGAIPSFAFCPDPEPPVEPPSGRDCALSSGYWGQHSIKGPAPYDDTWAQVGEDTPFFSSGFSYLDALRTPTRGKKYISLAKQYVAAYLNRLAGASARDDVSSAMAGALAYFEAGHTPDDDGNQDSQLLAWKDLLDQYNNGQAGTPKCDSDSGGGLSGCPSETDDGFTTDVSAMWKLSNGDGKQYGLRLDNLLTERYGTLRVWFDFSNSYSDMRLDYRASDKRVRIFGKTIGGAVTSSGQYQQALRFEIEFVYHNAQISIEDGEPVLTADPHEDDSGVVTSIDYGDHFTILPAEDSSSRFTVRNRRCRGGLDHRKNGSQTVSTWDFEVGDCVEEKDE